MSAKHLVVLAGSLALFGGGGPGRAQESKVFANPGLQPARPADEEDFRPESFGQISPTDNTAVFQATANAVCARSPRGGTIRLRARTYEVAPKSSIVASCPLHWIGQGWSEAPMASGTWLHIAQAASSARGGASLFAAGPGSAGTRFESFGVSEDQPAPSPGWSPIAYPPVFNLASVRGEVSIRDIMAGPVYDLVSSVDSGRTDLCGLYGQVLHRGIFVDLSFDTTHGSCGAIHFWPYWSQSDHVASWTAQNADAVTLGRVDGGTFPDIFVYAFRSAVRFLTSPNGEADLGSARYASAVHFGRIYADSTRITIWFNGASAANGIAFPNDITFDSIYAVCLGVGQPVHAGTSSNSAGFASSAVPQPGSFGILVDSNGAAQADISALSVYGCTDSALALGNTKLPSFFRIGALRTRQAGAVAIFAPGVTAIGENQSDIAVATKPDVDVNEFGPPGSSTLVSISRQPSYTQLVESGSAYQYGRPPAAKTENNANLMVLAGTKPQRNVSVDLPTSPYNGQTASIVSLVPLSSFRVSSAQRIVGEVPSLLKTDQRIDFSFNSGIGWIVMR